MSHLPPPPNNAQQNTRVWKDWFTKLQASVSAGVTATWASLDKTGSALADIVTRPHSSLQSILGSGSNHLSSTEQAAVTAAVAGSGFGNVTGPASAVSSHVVTFNGTTGKIIQDSGLTLSGTNTGDQTSVSGNAGTATTLQTARAINGVNFDGSAPITVPADAGTLTGTTLAAGVTTSSLTSFGVAPALGTPASGVLTNCTGTAASLTSGTVTTNANLTGDVTSVGNATTIVKAKRILANVTLGSPATSLASGTITACRFLEIHIFIPGYAGGDAASLQFNATGGTAYRYQWATMAAAATTFTAGLTAASTDRIKIAAVTTTNSRRVVAHISNDATITEKLVLFESKFGTGSAGTQATRDIGDGAWISGATTQITAISLISTSNMNAGTQMVVFGWN